MGSLVRDVLSLNKQQQQTIWTVGLMGRVKLGLWTWEVVSGSTLRPAAAAAASSRRLASSGGDLRNSLPILAFLALLSSALGMFKIGDQVRLMITAKT